MQEIEEEQRPFAGGLLDLLLTRPTELPRLPVGLLTREQKAAELQRVAALEAQTAAYKAELVLGLADDTPDDLDPAPGTPGARRGSWAPDTELPGVSEFFTAELAMVLNCGRRSASLLAHRCWVYRESLPATWAAMSAGALDEARAKVLVDVLEHTDPAVARAVEARLLPDAANVTTHSLRKRAIAALLAVDADAVDQRRKEAERHADVRVHPAPREGMATLAAELPAPTAAACHDVLDRLARMLKADGDERPVGQLRAHVLADLIQRPWDTSRPPVTAHLQLIAGLDALAGRSPEPGEVDGLPITIGQVRELLAQLDALGLRTPVGGSVTLALADDGAVRATAALDRLRRLARRGCPEHPVEDDCGCAVLDRPEPVDTYTPSAAQQTFIHTRDRTCRFPTCGQRVGWADADHVVPHACGGATDCANLCCLCRSHHRLKTFARGWRFAMDPDGVLHVTTPSGITRTTRPPGLRPPPSAADPPPPQPDPPAATEDPPPPDDDPPPF
ncbi:hypothetical protein JOD57_002994 [Geodermatophilus bullaregiensis]|uniref:HNH endonuclease signature motif containing protein n=1 Tax=Geodermatophilus bullaregiensis TaxID=1564160 RepID=UPI0027DBAFB1|nr:DUF222 domain-containing protein [Geodermatophilus bullaregiensis]MBM7807157.1 hypothetical protein [Geodermatophilus bullaregiensis]